MESSPRQPEQFGDPIEIRAPQPVAETGLPPINQPRYPKLRQLLTAPQPREVIDPRPQQARMHSGRFGDRGMTPQGRLQS